MELRLTFHEKALGLSLVLVERGERQFVVIDETNPTKGGGVAAALKPRDELVAVNDDALGHLDVSGFDALMLRLRDAPRPLTLVFRREQKTCVRRRKQPKVVASSDLTSKNDKWRCVLFLVCNLVLGVLSCLGRFLSKPSRPPSSVKGHDTRHGLLQKQASQPLLRTDNFLPNAAPMKNTNNSRHRRIASEPLYRPPAHDDAFNNIV